MLIIFLISDLHLFICLSDTVMSNKYFTASFQKNTWAILITITKDSETHDTSLESPNLDLLEFGNKVSVASS